MYLKNGMLKYCSCKKSMPDYGLRGSMLPELFQKTKNWRQIHMQTSFNFLFYTRFFINLLGFMPMRAYTE